MAETVKKLHKAAKPSAKKENSPIGELLGEDRNIVKLIIYSYVEFVLTGDLHLIKV